MSERERKQRLFDELWPCPEPPPDLAARVMRRMRQEARAEDAAKLGYEAPIAAAAAVAARPLPPPVPLFPRRRRWSPLAVGGAVTGLAAAAALLLTWGYLRSAPLELALDPALAPDGRLVATRAQMVAIGERAAASVESGADIVWSVRAKRVRVSQRRGSVLYRVRKGGPFQVVTPAGDVEVTGTSFRVTLAPGDDRAARAGTLVSVIEGSVRVKSGKREVALVAGQSARLLPDRQPELMKTSVSPAAAAVAVPPPAAISGAGAAFASLGDRAPADSYAGRGPAALLLPMARGLEVFGAGQSEVSLTLPSARSGAVVQVARDPRFTDQVWKGATRAGFVTVSAPGRGDLYWRLLGGATPRRTVGHARFRPEGPARPAPGRPHNLVTDERESTTVYFQNAAPALTLAFAPTAGARRYQVRLSSAAGKVLLERVVTEPRCPVPSELLAEGSYQWTAQPLDGRGSPRTRKLDLVYDNAQSTLTISQPAPGTAVAGSSVEVNGVAPLGARLYVNGRAVTVDEKGRFATTVVGSPRTLVFRVVDADGAESYWVRPLDRRS